MKTAALLLLISSSFALAQEARTISLRTLCFRRASADKEILLLGGTTEKPTTTAVPLFLSAYSDPVEVQVTGERMNFALPGKEEGEFINLGSGKVAEGARQVAVFIPSGDKEKPYNILVYDETEAAFPLGSTLLFNLSPESVRITVGEHDKTVQPGGLVNIPQAKKVNDLLQTTVRVFVPMEGDQGKWRPVTSTIWDANENLRNLAITYTNPRTKRTAVNSYQEVPPWRLPGADGQ